MKKHLYELARELGLPTKELIAELKGLGISAKSHMSTLTNEEYDLVKNLFLESMTQVPTCIEDSSSHSKNRNIALRPSVSLEPDAR